MTSKPKLVVSTGAGISAESGIKTFRDADGLWENYPVMDVASADGFRRNPALIHSFYNQRRRQLADVRPNRAHEILRELEERFDVYVITQNVDDLHERAGSSKVLHLHGELTKVRALDDPDLTFKIEPGVETTPETRIEGHAVRPHIVFFQEAVPMFEPATELAAQADVFVIVGTSLVVYPAAGLLHYVRRGVPVYYIDPNPSPVPEGVTVIRAKATEGMAELARLLDEQF
ncbi:MAG: NAD-dependent deacylase [Muribaculaceae bacterium]|jgi:NAD-dependent deacetylase|nr:NAD-dependent deacylase [Muribaculaceae bacterium]